MARTRGPELGEDGRARCPWALSAPDYVAYHDEEWGRPIHDDQGLYERLCLEGFQSGLSWLTVLRKRDNFRTAFADFDVPTVARFGDDDVERLMSDPGIIRNRPKIQAAIANARAARDLAPGELTELVWRYADPGAPPPRTLADVPATTDGSTALARELRRRGFRWVGPTTVYATMQACGLVNDHLAGCFCREQ